MVSLAQFAKRLPFGGALLAKRRASKWLVINGRRYKLATELSRSPNGVLYLGQDAAECEFVLKRPERCFDDEDEALFREEYDILRALENPHVVRAIDYGFDSNGKWPYIVMEHVRGHSLWQAIQACGEAAVFSYFFQTLQTCIFLHRSGIVHGDIKPDNILVTEDQQIKLADFGVAAPNGAIRKGFSPAFITPEQASVDGGDLPADSAGDFYAVGVTFYWLLTGHHPYFADSATIPFDYSCFAQPPKAPTELNSTIDGRWDDWLLGLIANNPQQRCQMAHAIDRQCAPEIKSPLHSHEIQRAFARNDRS